MSGFRNISAILRSEWLIDKQWADSHLPIVARILKGEKLDIFERRLPSLDDSAEGVNASTSSTDNGRDTFINERLLRYPMAATFNGSMVKASRWNSFNDAPKNSIAIIPVSGPIMKNGGDCGEAGAVHFTNWIKSANESDRITGIILQIDSPGGMVDGTQTVVDAIRASRKPVISFVDDGMMASAAVWIGTAAHEVYASHKTDTIGSIGVYTTLLDYRGYLEKMGLKELEIYAPQSADKNKAYRDALDGNEALIKEKLSFICDRFIAGVKENRKGKLNLEEENPFTGKMYKADQAISIGLIDGYSTIEKVAARIYELAKQEEKFYA